ncbi:MAG TPA: RDD family protein [Bacillaceae bacterium]
MQQAAVKASMGEEREYAGFWKRFGAMVIDSLILVGPLVIFSIVLVASIDTMDPDTSLALYVLVYALTMIEILLYFPICHSSKWQATFGKRAVGIKVIRPNGDRVSFWRAFGREWARALSGIFFIGYIMAAFTANKQALHDMIADTVVVRDPQKKPKKLE